ncbi:DCC1-like thiol-disulfide oxidoreductase family protein [uncultured Paracoccus sp.]|uniref:DCC1-like thiol-disulfide oxidoreductase family protein n=1 Tax=uncultured Paracoccus sp. TaxID=189685 RepID=UPI00345A6E9A
MCPTQSALGTALSRHYGLEPNDPETWLYLENGRAWSGMEAIIRIGAAVGGPGRLLGLMRVPPTGPGVALSSDRTQPLPLRQDRHLRDARSTAACAAAAMIL